jgi:hypothetical protein
LLRCPEWPRGGHRWRSANPGEAIRVQSSHLEPAGNLGPPEIQQLLIDYSTAIDQWRFDDLDRVFTEDAHIEL